MGRKLLVVVTALFMLTGLVVLTWSFHNLELTDRPEWMNWQMVLWPVLVFGLLDGIRWLHLKLRRAPLRTDWMRLVVHGIPAALVAAAPVGFFTNAFGPTAALSLLDFPTAKAMAAIWFAATLFGSWEVAY